MAYLGGGGSDPEAATDGLSDLGSGSAIPSGNGFDTAWRRQSAMLLMRSPPFPDGVIGAGDRRTLLGAYGGDQPADFGEFVRTRTRRSVEFAAKREQP